MRDDETIPITLELLRLRAKKSKRAGFPKPRWIEFCEALLSRYRLRLYQSKNTCYILVWLPGRPDYVVRFSGAPPSASNREDRDCDFFVGITPTTKWTWKDALEAVREHFGA